MGEPDFSFDGVEESDYFFIKDGEAVMDIVRQAVATGKFGEFEFVANDSAGNGYFLECLAFATLDRFGKDRLYFAVKDLEEEGNSWHTAYVAQNPDGEYLLVQEEEDEMFEAFQRRLNALSSVSEEAQAETAKKKSGKGWAIALKIILFPFWLIWQFIKALLSLFNIAVGDSSAVKAFKRGYNGDGAPMKEYTFVNGMGCEQTVYSSNGRELYGSDGSFVGTSDDGGKTIKEK